MQVFPIELGTHLGKERVVSKRDPLLEVACDRPVAKKNRWVEGSSDSQVEVGMVGKTKRLHLLARQA